jgi:hypothetical protein
MFFGVTKENQLSYDAGERYLQRWRLPFPSTADDNSQVVAAVRSFPSLAPLQ